MCNINRLVVSVGLLLTIASRAFSPTPRTPAGRHRLGGTSIWKAQRQQCRAESCLRAEEPSIRSPFSRRGFIGSCVAATVACGAVALSPANAEQGAGADNVEPRGNNYRNDFGSQTLVTGIENKPTPFQESISGFVSGSAVSTVKTLVKYPLDTATVRLQMPNTQFTIQIFQRCLLEASTV